MIEQRAARSLKLPDVDPTPAIFPTLTAATLSPGSTCDPTLQGLLDSTKQFIVERCYAWRTSNDFKFDLPASAFDEKRNRPLIEFIRHDEVEEELEVRALSQEQLASIREDGTFTVASRRYPVPYKWQLTDWLYKGKGRTYESLIDNIGTCFSVLYYTGQFIVGTQYLSIRKRGFHSIYFFWKLLRLFVGIRSTYESEKVSSEYLMEVERHYRLFQTVWQNLERELFDYLRAADDMTPEQKKLQQERVSQLQKLSEDFKSQWRAMIAKDSEVLLQRFNNDELKEVLAKQCQELYQRVVWSKVEIPRRILDCIESLIEDVTAIRKFEREKNQSIHEGRISSAKEIHEKYPIRSQSSTWFEKVQGKAVKLLTEAYQQTMIAELKRRIKSAAFPLYLEYLSQYDSRLEEVRQLVRQHNPTRTFQLSYPLCPPYEVEYTSGQYYRLITTKELEVTTSTELWRIKLYCVRYYTWLRNILFYTYRNMIYGRFGLFVLLRCYDFYPDYIINSVTGEVGRDINSKQTPVAAAIKNTVMSVGRAREQFENAPDTGFFGKTCGRIFNVIYLYFFVLVLYMVGYLLVLKPIIVLLNVIASLVVLVTAALWTPVALLGHYFWTLLVFNYDYQDSRPDERQTEITQRWFPLLLSTLKFLLDLCMLVLSFSLIFLSPLASFFLLLVFLLRYVTRRIYDHIMYVFISCCGRSPIRETCVAWKISGPGSARNYFFNLRQQDVYILVAAEMEKLQLEILQRRLVEELEKPQKIVQSFVNQIARKFGLSSTHIAAVSSSVSFYMNKLQQQISERHRALPDRPGGNVRFMEEELNLYVLNSKEIILGVVRKNPDYNFFEHLKVKEGDYDEMVAEVWIRIFGSDAVFEPLEKLDQRLEIVEKREVDEVGKIMSSISKDVNIRTKDQLQGERFVFRSERKNQRAQQRRINAEQYFREVDISQVVADVTSHTYEQLPDSKETIEYSVFSNANIQRIYAKYEGYLRGDSSSILS